jgi:tRNA threonylcarbamoyl adenosine modification protein YjeE
MLLKDAETLREYARRFAQTLHAPVCVTLSGDLGVGKTEFARAVIQEIKGLQTIVSSPTFTIVQDYGGISHFDLYRVKSAAELEEIGLSYALSRDIVLIEWPEVAESILPPCAIRVFLSVSGHGRLIKICGR